MCSGTERTDRPGRWERGQSTVEAAFALPIVLLAVLLLLQPGILLYDQMVMANAAAEGCRFLATSEPGDAVEDFIRRRLGAVPEQDLFHVHGGGCTWRIEMEGGQTAPEAKVSIATEVRPVPLLDYGARLLGLVNGNGNFEVRVEASMPAQPAWAAQSSLGLDPAAWVSAREGD